MRIFVAGATGAIGRRLVPMLAEQDHVVIATTRTARKSDELSGLGAEPVVVDLLDRDATVEAVVAAKPDVVIHQATALSGSFDLKHFDRFFATTNALRTTGTDNLVAAAVAAGASRLIVQSYTGWPNERTGSGLKTEQDRLDPDPSPTARQTVAAVRHLEAVVPSVEALTGIVLRYGSFYGPGTSIGRDGEVVEMVRKRRFPIVGGGAGVWSFVHIDDAAAATVAALEHGDAGLFNVVDDDPAPVRDWLPVLAEAVGAPRPMRVPGWLARAAIGSNGVRMMTEIRGSSNAKAKRDLGWSPRWPSWREGFRSALG